MVTESSYFNNPSRLDTETELQSLRNIVEHQLGAFRSIVITGVADIVLWILKSDHLFNTPTHKRIEVEKLLNPIADQVFEQMLQTTQRITDYPPSTTTTHLYFGSHDGHPITAMEDIVAYNLLILVYGTMDHQKKAFEMLLILKNESTQPFKSRGEMIGNLLELISNRPDCDLFVFIISKLFPGFVSYWDSLAFNVIPAKDLANPPSTLEAKYHIYCNVVVSVISEFCNGFAFWHKSFAGSGEGEDDQKVIDTLSIFTWDVTYSLLSWGIAEGAMSEICSAAPSAEHDEPLCGAAAPSAEHDVPLSGAAAPAEHDELLGLLSVGFLDSENALGRVGGPTVIDCLDNNQLRFLSQKEKGNGDQSAVDAKESRSRDNVKTLKEGERSTSLFHLVKSILPRFSNTTVGWARRPIRNNEEENKGFEESENELKSHAQAFAPRDLADRHRSLFLSRKRGGDIGSVLVEGESGHEGSPEQQN